jgi:hypothetical protein
VAATIVAIVVRTAAVAAAVAAVVAVVPVLTAVTKIIDVAILVAEPFGAKAVAIPTNNNIATVGNAPRSSPTRNFLRTIPGLLAGVTVV